jgi:hypothetical protein
MPSRDGRGRLQTDIYSRVILVPVREGASALWAWAGSPSPHQM